MSRFLDLPNDYDENCEDNIGEIDENILLELEENRNLRILSRFKEYISKEPEFYGIKNISEYKILEILENKNCKTVNLDISLETLDIFDDMYKEIYGISNSPIFYKSKISCIFNVIYV